VRKFVLQDKKNERFIQKKYIFVNRFFYGVLSKSSLIFEKALPDYSNLKT